MSQMQHSFHFVHCLLWILFLKFLLSVRHYLWLFIFNQRSVFLMYPLTIDTRLWFSITVTYNFDLIAMRIIHDGHENEDFVCSETLWHQFHTEVFLSISFMLCPWDAASLHQLSDELKVAVPACSHLSKHSLRLLKFRGKNYMDLDARN